MAEKAVSTINTILEISEDGKAWEKLCPIKNYPKLGGAPNQLETTDLEDESQTFINGVQSMDSMEFKANYLLETYKTVLAKSGIPLHYRLSMGKDGKDGVAGGGRGLCAGPSLLAGIQRDGSGPAGGLFYHRRRPACPFGSRKRERC